MPGKRRRNKEGCIGKRRPDGRIPGYVSLSTGGRKWVYGRSERDVRQKIRALIRDQEQGIQPPARLKRVGKLGLQEGQPKSRKGRRGMTLPGIVAAALRRHLDRQQAETATRDASWNPFKLVFCTDDGRQIDASVYRKGSCVTADDKLTQ